MTIPGIATGDGRYCYIISAFVSRFSSSRDILPRLPIIKDTPGVERDLWINVVLHLIIMMIPVEKIIMNIRHPGGWSFIKI